MKKAQLIFLIFLMTFMQLSSQEKYEKEYRLHASEVPKRASDLVQKWNFNTKIKWFAEESNDGKSFEAKLKFKDHYYSIEFSENGDVLDVEKTVKCSKLSKKTRENIEISLSKNFKKFKIKKIQIQFLGSENELYQAIFLQNNLPKNTNYEIVLKGKKTEQYLMFEVLLDSNFNILKELKFSDLNSINLEF